MFDHILENYQNSFSKKTYSEENNEDDLLMNIFDISPQIKRENKQYWGRELGMCWQMIVTEVCKSSDLFEGPLKDGANEPCDLRMGNFAIDTKYRLGSGDSGTLKKFKQYGSLLKERGYKPVLLLLREDNLSSAIAACRKGGWKIYVGDESFEFIKKVSGIDMKKHLIKKSKIYRIREKT